MPDFLHARYFHNTVYTWALATLAVIVIVVVVRLLRGLVISRLRTSAPQSNSLFDDIVLDIARRTYFFFTLAMGAAAASYILDLPRHWDARLRTTVTIAAIIQAGLWGNGVVRFMVIALVDRRADPNDRAAQTGKNMLRFVGLILVWSAVALLCMDNLGVNVTTLIAGLGVTGVAVAFATQNIVGDLFASVSILLDQPFLVGDFIICDAFMGSVEKIGIRSTRLRSLGGELLVMANSDLTKSRIRNYKNMYERRVLFTFAVRYETPHDSVFEVPAWVKQSITEAPRCRFDRAHLLSFGESGYQFEVVYYVLDADYNLYMDVQQIINFGIMRRFREHGVAFAYRTQIVYNTTLQPPESPRQRGASTGDTGA